MKKFLDFSHFKFDLLGGLTAGIVALPLALAFGEQSGLGAAAGLYGAAFISFFAALFGGTNTQISGPTAPMTTLSMAVVAGLLMTYEGNRELAVPVILMVFFLSGLVQVLLGVFKLGTLVKYIPYTVVSGFMTGIGVIILITQILPAIGYYSGNDQEVIENMKPHAEELILDRILMEEAEDGILVLEEFKETIDRAHAISQEDIHVEALTLAENDSKGVIGSLKYLPRAMSDINWMELLLAIITIAIIYGMKKVTKAIPSTLIALLAVSGTAYFMKLDYVQIQEIPSGIPIFRTDIFTGLDIMGLLPYLVSAIMLAFLGSIDSLLTSVVADNLTGTQHRPNKELVGQGIGNSIAALFGGLPGAGATIRTVVNIQAGGKTKLSGMVAGVLLFVILIFLGPIASQIPAAVLAGILITVGFGVMDRKGLMAFPKMELSEKIVLITVLLLTVFWQLVYAVAVGLVLAALLFLKRMSDFSAKRTVVRSMQTSLEDDGAMWEDEKSIAPAIREKVMIKHMSGPMFFGVVDEFRSTIAQLESIHILVIRMEKVPFMDQSGVYALESAIDDLQTQDVKVVFTGANKQVHGLMRDMKLVPGKVPEQFLFKNLKECRVWMRKELENHER